MDNQRARIARLTMMALRRGLVLLELLGLLHLPRLFPLQFERLVLHGHRIKCAGRLLADPDEGIDQGGGVGALRLDGQCISHDPEHTGDDTLNYRVAHGLPSATFLTA